MVVAFVAVASPSAAQSPGSLYSTIRVDPYRSLLAPIDQATGGLTTGSSYITDLGFQIPIDYLGPLAFAPDGTLYDLTKDNLGSSALTTLDTLTGKFGGLTYVYEDLLGFKLPFASATDMAFAPDGTLFISTNSSGTAALVTVDAQTGVISNFFNIANGGNGEPASSLASIAISADGTLYGLAKNGDNLTDLITINPLTGAIESSNTLYALGFPVPFSLVGDFSFGPDGLAYALVNRPSSGPANLISFDTTGDIKDVVGITALGFPVSYGAIGDIAFMPSAAIAPGPAPEPTGWLLLLSGFGVVGGALRRRKQTSRTPSLLGGSRSQATMAGATVRSS